MKKQVNFSWPAKLLDFKKDKRQENFSRGKLKVFYQGETADHRFFSKDFSEKLIKSLPYTPVVSFYDEEKQDFVGHATEQQILGIVDPCLEPSFSKDEDGTVWCVCDVVLYTERPDSTGELAKKIEGHPQSLELNPETVKYKINYDEKRHVKNIEFTAGDFIGVSVLGYDQKPAFTGSAFFSYDEKFEEKMKLLRDYCETKEDQERGGKDMNFDEFMTLSWGEKSKKIFEKISDEYSKDGYVYPVDIFDGYAIINVYYFLEDKSKMIKINYTLAEGGKVELGDAVEVHIVYEEIPAEDFSEVKENPLEGVVEEVGNNQEPVSEKIEEKEESFNEEPNSEVEEPSSENKEENPEVKEPSSENKEESPEIKEPVLENTTVTPAGNSQEIISNAEETPINKVDNNEQRTEEKDSSSTSLSESEREEFEALKKERKVRLINDYRESLGEEFYSELASKIDDFTEENLELVLLREYKKSTENNGMRSFTLPSPQEHRNESVLDALIRENL